jgi:hypothetical protein
VNHLLAGASERTRASVAENLNAHSSLNRIHCIVSPSPAVSDTKSAINVGITSWTARCSVILYALEDKTSK